MPSKFEWSEIVIVGLVGGIAAGCIGLAVRLGATVDNILNFSGGAVGAGLAVVATLWLESHRRDRALEQMLTSLMISASVAMRFNTIGDNQLVPLIVTFKQSAEAFEASRLGANIQNPIHQYAFQSAVFWLRQSVEEMDGYMKSYAAGDFDLKTFSNKSRKCATTVTGAVEDFLRVPGLPKSPLKSFEYHKSRINIEL